MRNIAPLFMRNMYIPLVIIIIVLFALSLLLWRSRVRLIHRLALFEGGSYGQRYQEIFENASDAIFVIEVSPAGSYRFDSLNPAAAQIIDAGCIGLAHKTFAEIILHSGNAELTRVLRELSGYLAQAISTGLPVRYEGTRCDIPLTCEINLVPMVDDNGISHILCFARNMSAQKLYEQEMLARVRLEEKLSRFAASAPGFFYTYRHGANGSNAMPFASVGINELFGLQPQDVAQDISPLNLLINADDMKLFFEATAHSAVEMSPLLIEFRVSHPAKGELWVEARALPKAEADGSVVWHGFMHEVTERKRVECALQTSHEHLAETQARLRELLVNRESLREDERKRISWEMHEELGQLLAAMKLHIYTMRAPFPENNHGLKDASLSLSRLVDKSIKTVHDIVSGLRPTVLLFGITPSLEWLVSEFSKHPDVVCELRAEDDSYANEELTTLVFRVAQDSLENIIRYSGISSVRILWRKDARSYILTLTHDGYVDTGDLFGGQSLSFFGIQERVKAYGGEMSILNESERRSIIEARFPIQ